MRIFLRLIRVYTERDEIGRNRPFSRNTRMIRKCLKKLNVPLSSQFLGGRQNVPLLKYPLSVSLDFFFIIIINSKLVFIYLSLNRKHLYYVCV